MPTVDRSADSFLSDLEDSRGTVMETMKLLQGGRGGKDRRQRQEASLFRERERRSRQVRRQSDIVLIQQQIRSGQERRQPNASFPIPTLERRQYGERRASERLP
jgi:septum formation inhibitor MinC